MSTNLVVINGSRGLTWSVEDSEMDKLMEFLHTVGAHQQPVLEDEGTVGDSSPEGHWNPGLEIDPSRHWNPVLEIDPSRGVQEVK